MTRGGRREGAGRPKTTGPTTTLIRVSKAVAAALRDEARAREISAGAVVAEMLAARMRDVDGR